MPESRAANPRNIPLVIAIVAAIVVCTLIALRVFLPGFHVPARLVELLKQTHAPNEPIRPELSAEQQQQAVWLEKFWNGLLSDSDDRRVAALQLLRDVPDIATYPVRGWPVWTDKGMLALAIGDKTIDSDMKSFMPLFKQVIPALAAGSPPFADWEPAARSRVLLALQRCAINMRQFALSMDAAPNPPQAMLMPKQHTLHNLQLDLCIKSTFIRDAVLKAADKERLRLCDGETLRAWQQALKQDRKTDGQLMRAAMQEFNQFGQDLGRIGDELQRQAGDH